MLPREITRFLYCVSGQRKKGSHSLTDKQNCETCFAFSIIVMSCLTCPKFRDVISVQCNEKKLNAYPLFQFIFKTLKMNNLKNKQVNWSDLGYFFIHQSTTRNLPPICNKINLKITNNVLKRILKKEVRKKKTAYFSYHLIILFISTF